MDSQDCYYQCFWLWRFDSSFLVEKILDLDLFILLINWLYKGYELQHGLSWGVRTCKYLNSTLFSSRLVAL